MEQQKHEQLCQTYWAIREQAQSDPEYARLLQEMKELELACQQMG